MVSSVGNFGIGKNGGRAPNEVDIRSYTRMDQPSTAMRHIAPGHAVSMVALVSLVVLRVWVGMERGGRSCGNCARVDWV